jgi:uroporphyrin-III C-methyltransferase/precorrin-2 dehydrogenase/sirohydrochlorin ferrochelatase
VVCAGAGELGHAMAARARRNGLPVNVMDEPQHSSFIVPAIVDRGDVVVAIGTGGSAPVLARRLREKIEMLLPARIGDLAALIGRWRKPLASKVADHARRRFWEQVVDGPIGAAVLEGRKLEAERALAELAAAPVDTSARGFVTLVGAGPGDPDLLTVKALRALQDADIVFYDELVAPAVLDRIRRDATRVPVGRRVGRPGIGQDAIHRLLIEAARRGQRVVRLKGGDPFVFGRGGEEVAALREASIPYAVVPGITAALGAASAFDVPLTYRGLALRITFLTAHKERDAEAVDWTALTDEKMTVVVYMGVTAAPAVRAGLLAAGRSPTTPVGVFARVTRPDQQASVGILDDLPTLVAQTGEGPAVLVIGDVVTHSAPWRANNPFELLSSLGIAAE